MALRHPVGSMAFIGVLCAAASAGFAGCSSSSSGTTPADAGTDSSTTHDTGVAETSGAVDSSQGSEGAAGESGVPEASEASGGLSARAQAGLAASPFPVPAASQTEQVGMGSYIVNVVSSCPDCHNKAGAPGTGFLAGGTAFGPVQARNLTSDPTNGLRMTQAQFVETLQTGKDQKLSADASTPVALIVMPWEDFRWMSLTDPQSVYAYLQLVPADPNAVPTGAPGGPPIPMPTTFTDGATTPAPTLPAESGDAPLFAARGRAIQVPVEPSAVASLSAADQASYGRGAYLVGQAACGDCHTNPERPSFTSTAYNAAQWLTGGRVFAAGSPARPTRPRRTRRCTARRACPARPV